MLWIAAAILFVLPIADADARAQEGDDAVRANDLAAADAAFRAAARISPLPNADYLYRSARVSMIAHAPDGQTQLLLSQAIAANPMDAGNYMMRAEYELRKPPGEQNRQQLLLDMTRAVSLDPNNVEGHLRLAAYINCPGIRPRRRRKSAWHERRTPCSTRTTPSG